MNLKRLFNSRMSVALVSCLLSACSANNPVVNQAPKDANMSKNITTFEITTLQEAPAGAPLVKAGQTATVHYTGWCFGKTKNDAFDSSVKRGQPFKFVVGKGSVIRGWDLGLQQMAVGGTYEITMAPAYGYGASGAGGLIPPNAVLVFEIQVLAAQ